MNQKGVIHLALPLFLLLFMAVLTFVFLIYFGIIKNPLNTLPVPGVKKEPTVSLQNQYQNPFDKSSQYVNPFASYKNPFDALKK
ncbi:MAG: hypothetical protein Q8P92_03585 [Candidatus Daviesbacteria bacterium]|nr:hypothetical protein [Candidatus Daviesbacteria bacterium]